jgi:hypothetical protein
MQNSNATCQARARQHYDSSTRHKLDSLDRETRQKLDSFSTARQAGAWSQPRQARQARQARPRHSLDNGLDSASTEPRQLDSSTARAQVTGSLPAPPGVFLPVLETSVAGGPRRLGGGVSVGGPRRPATAVPGGARRLLRHVAQMWARVRARADGWAVVARSWESARARAMG